jgi:competence protein ComEC
VFTKNYKKLLAAALIIVALAVIRFYQAPGNSGAVLNAFDINATSTSNNLKLVFFDVGQGDSSLIITPDGEDILVDGGPDNKVVQKLGEYLPYSDRKIEYIILTHPHADHLTGLLEVLKRYEVGKIIMTRVVHTTNDYQEFLRLIKEKNIPVLIIDKQQGLAIGGINLDFLEPEKSFFEARPDNLNNSSIVFKLDFVSTTALYTGDFENEEDLLLYSLTTLAANVLKVGHHGSTNANDEDFIKAVDPEFAIISVGKDNKFGHPHYRTLHYLQETGAEIFRTDESGDVVIISDGQKYRLDR